MPEQVKKTLVLSIYFALIASAFLVFWQVRNFNFINFDDRIYVYENPHVLNGLTTGNVIWAFTNGHAAFWHPLTWLSYMLDRQLFGPGPGGFHLTNLIFHIANTLLLFLVLKQMTDALWQSAFVAALFAFHPLHVESFAWIAERKDVLSIFFWLLTMSAYWKYVKKPGTTRYLLVLLIFALGLMAKPMLVTLPFVFLLLDYWPLDRIRRFQWKILYRLVLEKIPFIALSIASSAIAFLTQQSSGAIFASLPLKFRIGNALISYMKYMEKMVWPARLAVYYPHPVENVSVLYAVVSAVVLSIVTILVIRFAKNHRYLITGWFWYLGTLIPVIGIIQVGNHAMADRYTYITLTGLFIIIAWGLPELLAKLPQRKIVLGSSMTIVLTVLGICAHQQLSYWKDSFTLFSHAIEVTQNNDVAYNNLGNAYESLGCLSQAMEAFDRAIEISPDYAAAHYSLGITYARLERWPQAIDAFKQAIEIDPDYTDAYNNLGVVYGNLGRYNEAIDAFKQAVKIEPDSAGTYYNLGRAYLAIGDKNSALAEYNILKSLSPQLADKLLNQINK
jgi:protein O-mannosyl-transferase